MLRAIIASTSTVHGSGYLEYLSEVIEDLYRGVDEILFIPYARPGGISHEEYTEKASVFFKRMHKTIVGIQEFDDPRIAVAQASGIFVGGGNTFVLVDDLYKYKIMHILRDMVIHGTPYLGTSAGSNICGLTMGTTNDMPIAFPPSFNTLGILPFNINPHYLDPDPGSTHMGETREMRIMEFHKFNQQPVIGLREGSYLSCMKEKIILEGPHTARWFTHDAEPTELQPGSEL